MEVRLSSLYHAANRRGEYSTKYTEYCNSCIHPRLFVRHTNRCAVSCSFHQFCRYRNLVEWSYNSCYHLLYFCLYQDDDLELIQCCCTAVLYNYSLEEGSSWSTRGRQCRRLTWMHQDRMVVFSLSLISTALSLSAVSHSILLLRHLWKTVPPRRYQRYSYVVIG